SRDRPLERRRVAVSETGVRPAGGSLALADRGACRPGSALRGLLRDVRLGVPNQGFRILLPRLCVDVHQNHPWRSVPLAERDDRGAPTDGVPRMTGTTPRTIPVQRDIQADAKRLAAEQRDDFSRRGTLVVNLVSSPGSGKTSLLEATARHWGG